MYAHRSFSYYNGLTDIVTLFGSQDSRVSLFYYSPTINTSGRYTTPDSLCEKTLQQCFDIRTSLATQTDSDFCDLNFLYVTRFGKRGLILASDF